MLEAFLAQLRAAGPTRAPPSSSGTGPGSATTSTRSCGRKAALCIAEAEDLATPLEATAAWGYLRLRRQDYDEAALAAWADRLRALPWDEAYVYLQARGRGEGPKLAARMIALCGANYGILARPTDHNCSHASSSDIATATVSLRPRQPSR